MRKRFLPIEKNRAVEFLKKETVLCAALFLAVLSAFFVPPDAAYAEYMDYRTLAILFCLMCVMAGLRKTGVFAFIAGKLLERVKCGQSLVFILVFLCFFFSMFITNDVALITFIPFTFTVLELLGEEQKQKLILPVVAMQTIAANLGSMLLPTGNPQNLYLYGKSELSIGRFVLLMLPYTLLSFLLLFVWSMRVGKTAHRGPILGKEEFLRPKAYPLAMYLGLFFLCLLAVGRILPWQAVFAAVFFIVLVADRHIFAEVDYSLLITFAGFFIFIGNLGRISAFRDFVQSIIIGRETYVSVFASQIISNVPAALLLSGFSDRYSELIVGTNLGGLGTLIASMASLISYKYIAAKEGKRKGSYLGLFTAGNICFLAVLLILYYMIKTMAQG